MRPLVDEMACCCDALAAAATDLEGLHAAHRRAEMKAHSLETSSINLQCERPSLCGIDQSTSLYDAILKHTDLSVEALHLSVFDMFQPIRDVLQSPQCNITVTMPAADAILRGGKLKVGSLRLPAGSRGPADKPMPFHR
jgi:hypothetical protein